MHSATSNLAARTACISPISPLYLPYISAISPLTSPRGRLKAQPQNSGWYGEPHTWLGLGLGLGLTITLTLTLTLTLSLTLTLTLTLSLSLILTLTLTVALILTLTLTRTLTLTAKVRLPTSLAPAALRRRCLSLYLPYISPTSPLYLPYISPISPLTCSPSTHVPESCKYSATPYPRYRGDIGEMTGRCKGDIGEI
jgi:hypothetical protein